MYQMEIAGFFCAVLIGVTLGLIGSGGSILTVPVLVYLFGISPVIATAYSLFVVGITALTGTIRYTKKRLINFKVGLMFALPSFLGVFLARRFLLPWLPDPVLTFNSVTVSKDVFIMVSFAVMMVAAAMAMIRDNKTEEQLDKPVRSYHYLLINIEGFVVGILTGLVGAGGGFLIIPALVLLAKIPMREAVGTSLMIIAAKSLLGFTGDIGVGYSIDWAFIGVFSAFSIAGIFIGVRLAGKIASTKLKPAFGWFVLVMACYILIREI
jgi:uncharacterized protein